MTDRAMINALACRMFSGYSSEVSSKYDSILNTVNKENQKTRGLSNYVREVIENNFIKADRTGWETFYKMDKDLEEILSDYVGSDFDHLVWSWSYQGVFYYRMYDVKSIDVCFVVDALRAEQAIKFAENMIEQGREGIVLTLPVQEKLVELLANYENNKSRADKFMEEEFPGILKEIEEYREKLYEIKKVVEDLLEDRNQKSRPKATQTKKVETKENVSVEVDVVVKVNGGVVQGNKSLCQRFIDWWKSV